MPFSISYPNPTIRSLRTVTSLSGLKRHLCLVMYAISLAVSMSCEYNFALHPSETCVYALQSRASHQRFTFVSLADLPPRLKYQASTRPVETET